MSQLGGGLTAAAAAAAAAAAGGPPVREVAESCLELLCMQLAVGWKVGGPDLAARRAEAIGFQVGSQLAERYTKDRLRFVDHLEVIKFLCKEFWAEVFKKQIDNLKTNHRGVFVLHDNRFRWLSHLSVNPPPPSALPAPPPTAPLPPPVPSTTTAAAAAAVATLAASAAAGKPLPGAPQTAIAAAQQAASAAAAAAAAAPLLFFPCGILRGALTALGVPCTVSAQVSQLPACEFTVKLKA